MGLGLPGIPDVLVPPFSCHHPRFRVTIPVFVSPGDSSLMQCCWKLFDCLLCSGSP